MLSYSVIAQQIDKGQFKANLQTEKFDPVSSNIYWGISLISIGTLVMSAHLFEGNRDSPEAVRGTTIIGLPIVGIGFGMVGVGVYFDSKRKYTPVDPRTIKYF